jgi:hypothetical protein
VLTRIAFCAALFAVTACADDPKAAREKALGEAMARWNKAADGVQVPFPGGRAVGLEWVNDAFPHPTFKGGSKEAYGEFARVLVKFLDGKGTFDLLAENDLFAHPLRYGRPGVAETTWTFGKLIADFAQPAAHGDHDDATRKALKGYADKIADRAKKKDE